MYSTIATEIKLSTTNIDKLNLKLIKTFTYLSQFCLNVRYRFDKFNVISNALSRLLVIKERSENTLKINTDNSKSRSNQVYAYSITLVEMLANFRRILIDDYVKNLT